MHFHQILPAVVFLFFRLIMFPKWSQLDSYNTGSLFKSWIYATGYFITDLPHEYSASKYRVVFPSDHPFTIDPSSGNVGLKDEVDYEDVKEYTIVVEEVNLNAANEYINYLLQINLVDANDNKPYFTMKDLFAKVCWILRFGLFCMTY